MDNRTDLLLFILFWIGWVALFFCGGWFLYTPERRHMGGWSLVALLLIGLLGWKVYHLK